MRISNKHILILILLTGAVLRFYNFQNIPFTHDELSAALRLNSNSFSDLIEQGIKVDGHPAGVQTLLYYMAKSFGLTEWIIKLPFALAGLVSIYLVFIIGKKWFNESTGLIAAAYVSSIQYTIMHSQIARPYAFGLMFCLFTVWFWTKLMFNTQKRFWLNGIWFAFSAAACAYSHHFSLLFAIIIGISGLFIIPKPYRFKYSILGVLIFALYTPHLPIFFHQLSLGGVGNWLAKPTLSFFPHYFKYIFQYSWFSIIPFIVLAYSNFKSRNHATGFKIKLLGLSAIWFALPLIIGYLYSVYISSVLQTSVLLFSFPFLLFALFGAINNLKPLNNFKVVVSILVINAFVLINEREHYTLLYTSPYQAMVNDAIDYYDIKPVYLFEGDRKITQIEIKKRGFKQAIVWLQDFKNEREFVYWLNQIKAENKHLYFAGETTSKPNTLPLITAVYGNINSQKNYAGATTFLFSQEKQASPIPKQNYLLDFESTVTEHWNFANSGSTAADSNNQYYQVLPTNSWFPSFEIALNELAYHKNNFIDARVDIRSTDEIEELLLVSVLTNMDEEIYWSATKFKDQVKQSSQNKWQTLYHSLKLSDIQKINHNTKLKVFVWNKSKQSFQLDNFNISTRAGNPKLYKLYDE